jgi:hypothetical protein
VIILAIEKKEYYRVYTNVLMPIDASVDNQIQQMNAQSIPFYSASDLKTYLDTFLNQIIAAEAMTPNVLYITSLSVVRCAQFSDVPTTP